jgi:hypothetical protein
MVSLKVHFYTAAKAAEWRVNVNINFESEKPIFTQIAEGIEDSILSAAYREENTRYRPIH